MIKGAIFDMDGTLLDAMPVWEHASEQYLEKRGIAVTEKLSEVLFSMSMRQGALYVKEKYGLTEEVDAIIAGGNAIVFEAYEKEVQPKAGVGAFLEGLQRAGFRVAGLYDAASKAEQAAIVAAADIYRHDLLDFPGIWAAMTAGGGQDAERMNR